MSTDAQQDAVLGALQRTGLSLQMGDLARETGLPEAQVREGLADLVAGDLVVESHGGFFSAMGGDGLVAAVPPIETLEPLVPEAEAQRGVVVPDAPRGTTEVHDDEGLTLNSVFRAMLSDDRPLSVRAEVVMDADAEGALSVRRVVRILGMELGE